MKPEGSAFVPNVYTKLLFDKRIPDGAFRLWHYLRHRADALGICWPSQRTIASDLGCKPHSIKGWQATLVRAGYLKIEVFGQRHQFRYTVLQGDGLALPKKATPSKILALPISHSRVAQMGNRINNNELTTLSKESKGSPPVEVIPPKRPAFSGGVTLATARQGKRPSESHVLGFIERRELSRIQDLRPDIYHEIDWDQVNNWQAFLLGLEDTLNQATTG